MGIIANRPHAVRVSQFPFCSLIVCVGGRGDMRCAPFVINDSICHWTRDIVKESEFLLCNAAATCEIPFNVAASVRRLVAAYISLCEYR